jgi:endonuclease/exonuclease/phosphatase family metal-dependent hydrolase
MSHELRLMTYNIRKGKGANGRAKNSMPRLSDALETLKVDLLLCQEVFHGEKERVSQSALLARNLQMNCYYGANKFRQVGHHGNTTFTRLKVERFENHDISTNRLEKRGALYLRLKFNSGSLHVFNVHLGLNKIQRREQLMRIQRMVPERCGDDDPVVLAGDFNDWSRRLDRTVVEQLGFRNAFADLEHKETRTWHARKPLFNLDRIYLKNLTVKKVERLNGEPWSRLSDHLPLLAEVACA